MKHRLAHLTVVLFAGFVGFGSSSAQEGVNLLVNGGFEAGVLAPWTIWSSWGDVTREVVQQLDGAAVPEEPIEGEFCLHLVVPTPSGVASWEACLQQLGSVFEEGKKYTHSAFLKCREGTMQIGFELQIGQDPWTVHSAQTFTITEEWAEYSLTSPVFTETVFPGNVVFRMAYGVGDFWVDAVRFYEGDHVPAVFEKRLTASKPSPEGAAVDVPHDAVLSWMPGPFAATHDVYLGTTFADVNDADRSDPRGVLVSQGQTATRCHPPDQLDFGQTYYWRVDEVNAAPDSTIHRGNVWSFTVEPYVYPVGNIVATASSAEEGAGPENTIDGSGLNPTDQHSIAATDMWLTEVDGEPPVWICYEFGEVCKLHEMWVWNYNVQFEMVLGFGVREVTVEYSIDGEDWTALGDFELARATARTTYTHNTTIDLDGVIARYVRLTAHNNWSGLMPQFGLSEVRFYYKPVVAREPSPADGQMGCGLDVALDWRGGREAAAHEIYFSDDEQAVIDGTALIDSVAQKRYEVGALDLGTTYYWRVDEVNEAASPSSWPGPVWSFSTVEYVTVEDFESYDDDIDGGTAIFQTWIDGWENNTGSTVGHLETPFAERTVVHSGRQSMPLLYDNSASPFYSEAERTFDALQDWTVSGADSLSLYFRGVAENSPQTLYVMLEDSVGQTATVSHGDPEALLAAEWQQWRIPYSDLAGVNLGRIRTMVIGVGSRTSPTAGGTGIVYIDDVGFGRRQDTE